MGFSRILRADISSNDWVLIKKHIENKFGDAFLDIPNKILKRTFIHQPYGSQQFPDFIVFTDKKVVPLEVKFSTKKQVKPIWNSNVPRANAFYIFGSYGLKDITFFCGNDILSQKHRKNLYGFFNHIRKLQDKIRKDMPVLDTTDRGFTPYIRSAFDQVPHKKSVGTNFFTHPKRRRVENLAITKSREL